MNASRPLPYVAIFALCLAAVPAAAIDPVTQGALNVPANRLVGMWSTDAVVRPCHDATLPSSRTRNTLMFHAGGTALANPQFPLGGVPNALGIPGMHYRGPDLGTWSYDPRTLQYTAKLRFDWYVDGMYHGYQTVDRIILLSPDGNRAVGPVRSVRYTAAGAVLSAVCGDAVSIRL